MTRKEPRDMYLQPSLELGQLRRFARPLTYSTQDVIDNRISVPAQHSLVRLSKNPATSVDAVRMLGEIKAGRLAGIFCVNWKIPAQRALRFGSSWWTVIPKSEDGILMLDPDNPLAGRPLIAFRRDLDPQCGLLQGETRRPASPSRIDAALLKAWSSYKRLRGRQLTRCPTSRDGGSVTTELLEIGSPVVAPISNILPPILCQLRRRRRRPRPTPRPTPAPAVDAWATADSETNILLHPARIAPTRQGQLAALQGGLVTDSSLRPRVSAIIGPGATLTGLANRLLPLYNNAATTRPINRLSVAELANGIAVYNSLYLPLTNMRSYRDGFRLPLPIEIDQKTGEWILNSNFIRLWAGTFPAGSQNALTQRPSHLNQPDSATLVNEVATFLRNNKEPLARGINLQARALTNPFDAVFFFFETFRQLGADAFDVTLEFMNNSVNHQLGLLGTLTAGNAILRRLLQALESPPPSLSPARQKDATRAQDVLRRALGIGGTLIKPREVPETRQQLRARRGGTPGLRDLPEDPLGGNHRMVLGRDILAGVIGKFRSFEGAAYTGRMTPGRFVQVRSNLLDADRADPQFQPRLDIILAIAPNEGLLDAIRMQDAGILSTGIHQWSAHADLELPSLLRRFKEANADEFMLYFGIYRLEVRRSGTFSSMLQEVQPNGQTVDLLNSATRTTFFGGTKAGGVTVFPTDWAARVREAAISSVAYNLAQIREAVGRFDRIIRDVGNITVTLRGARVQIPVNRLITSQRGVALILDSHINQPGNVRKDLQRAADAVGRQPNEDALDRRISDRYETNRSVFNRTNRNQQIIDRQLPRNHGSFVGW